MQAGSYRFESGYLQRPDKKMLYQLAKDKAKRAIVRQEEVRRLSLKFMILSFHQYGLYPWLLRGALAGRPRNGSPVRVRNRCLLTGRGQGVHRRFKLSRIALREEGTQGRIPGLRKSSW